MINCNYLFFMMVFLYPIFSTATEQKANNFLVISDIHLNLNSQHLMEFSPSKKLAANDLDLPTFKALISDTRKNIKNGVISKPAFIIILGDIQGHARDVKKIPETEATVFKVIKETFPNTPIFYTFGNNDALSAHYGPFTASEKNDPLKNPYEIAMHAGWDRGFLSTGTYCDKEKKYPCIINEDSTNGYYSAWIAPNLRLITLNSVLFSTKRQGVTQQEALHQLQWFEEQLKNAKMNHESSIIAMHVPPGQNILDHSAFWMEDNLASFLKIIQTYQANIVGILGSHTHKEEIKIIRNAAGKNLAGVYYTPALSTIYGNEPALKTFYFAQQNKQWVLTNYKTFHFSMVNSNLVVSKLYDYVGYYCTGKHQILFDCLNDVTIEKMKKYFSAGNKNFAGIIAYPGDMVLVTPNEGIE